MNPRLIWIAACTILVWLAVAGPAAAHGTLRTTRPEAGSTAPRVPRQIEIDFTEPPTNDPTIGIKDGCRRPVALDVTRTPEGMVNVAVDKTAQPGKFTVTYRIVSATDGHPSRGSYSFTVSGKKDCSQDKPKKTEPPGASSGDGGGEQAGAPDPAPEDVGGGSSWLLLVGGGTLLLVVVAFVLRRSGGGGSSA